MEEDCSIKIHQEAKAVLKHFNFSVSTPMLKFGEISQLGKKDNAKQKFPYRDQIWPTVLSKYLENPTAEHGIRLKTFVAGTTNYGITYMSNPESASFEC
ncbi:hypothetical protein GWI33_017383 [Rhynchophorus ferrugineus]|uniref:Uncharacterized protein n=1 Tax=Rhynchophorus ferrugineus TaxID=354439 RepID=A0A834HZW0_RHYFE|nr:hypothetical protein GWI33_017383 [Rhynchophorus ferrugineus]